jgi:hypothetical protein
MMIEPESMDEWLTFGYIKRIPVKRLKEILDTFPNDYWIYSKTLAHTGNLVITDSNDIRKGIIDIGEEIYDPIFEDESC